MSARTSRPDLRVMIFMLETGSATGVAAIQLLKLAFPVLVIFGTASLQHFEELRLHGITQCFDYSSNNLVRDIRAATSGGVGVDMP